MAEYYLLTIWRIEAPLEAVYAAIENSLRWPDWWPSVRQVEQTANGDEHGINSVRRYAWQGQLPYLVLLEVCATRVERGVTIEGAAQGDLEGVGRWHFSRQGTISVVHFEWHVRSTRWWMNLLAPVARSVFIRNHEQIMAQGGRALARLLSAPLIGQETIDLIANPAVAHACQTTRTASKR
ncbi:MAG: SRPBCC family protein [Pseudomonadota bacterium]